MRVATLVLVFQLIAQAADKYVCDTPQNGHPCNYPNAQLQLAFDQALPGDTLYLQAGFTYLGGFVFRTNAPPDQPITVTTSKADWLPGPNSRISPAHLPNLPVLKAINLNQPALSGNLDNSRRPPSNWHFTGLGFSAATQWEFDNSIIHTAGMGVNDWTIANSGELPDGLVFDRILVFPPYDDSMTIQNGVRLNGTNLVLKNSFIWPIFCAGIECHAVSTQSNPGPLSVTNNFLSAASVPLFTGGTEPDFPGVSVPADLTVQYNYMFRPLKWWGNPGNPDYAYFLRNGSKWACTKNLLEFKAADRAMVQYNVHENVWADNICQGQWFGYAATPRQTEWESPASGGSWGRSLGMDRLTAFGNTFSWTGSANTMAPGHNICIEDFTNIPAGIYDCHKILSVDNNARIGTVTTPFLLSAFNATKWCWVTDDTPLLRDVTLQNEVFRNVAGGYNILARDRGSASSGNEGRIIRMAIRNTLISNTIPALGNNPALRIFPQEVQFAVDPETSGQGISFEHNTYSTVNPFYNVLYFADEGLINPVARIRNLTIRSNIFPDATADDYALGASGYAFNDWNIAEHFLSGDSALTNNQMWSVKSNCLAVDCSSNLSGTFSSAVQFIPGTFALRPGNILSSAGHDGADVGVNYYELPLISNLTVTPQSTSAVLEFNLNAPVENAAGSQPCVLEVSSNENLKSYLGAYQVTNDLNPAYFKQADVSNRSNSALLPVRAAVVRGPLRQHSFAVVRWPVGQNATVPGDDGLSHYLGLTSNTQYWGRLMCYGDTQTFSFTTLPQ